MADKGPGDHHNQTTLFAWYVVIFIVFGVALATTAVAVYERLKLDTPHLAKLGAVFGVIWAGLMFATAMISNIGIDAVAKLAASDPSQAEAVWSSIDAVTNGLGGGNELVGGLWVLLVSWAGLRSDALPRRLNHLGLGAALAGLVAIVPGLEDVGMGFGLGLIVWFAWLGAVLIRHDHR